ncbi:MAG: hypothetical protein MHM6MM_001670 [Cercozoa sp. M6MM]
MERKPRTRRSSAARRFRAVANAASLVQQQRRTTQRRERFTRYVPNVVADFAASLRPEEFDPPMRQEFDALVVMWVDVSGFTKMTEALAHSGGARGTEDLGFFLNRYLEILLRSVAKNSGDVIKFAGDAMLIVFEPPPIDLDADHAARQMSLQVACHRALQAASAIQTELHQAELADGVTLSVKIGLSVGPADILHVGGVYTRMEFTLVGTPCIEAFDAEHDANAGDTIMSDAFYARCDQTLFRVDQLPSGNWRLRDLEMVRLVRGAKAARRHGAKERAPRFRVVRLPRKTEGVPARRAKKEDKENASSVDTSVLSNAVTDAVVEQRLKRYIPQAVARHLKIGTMFWIPEIRHVTTLFVSIGFSLKFMQGVGDTETSEPSVKDLFGALGNNASSPDSQLTASAHASLLNEVLANPSPVGRKNAALRRVHDVIRRCQRAIYKYEGSLNKFLVDDKGSTLIACFGVPPLAHEDDALRAVMAAVALQDSIAVHMGLRTSIGVSTGQVFLGALGSGQSAEYAVLGDAVNLAARLMQRAQRRTQILIDAATRQLLGGGRGGSAVPVTGRAPGDAAADRARADAAASRFVIERLGNVHVKGKSQAIPVWAVKSKTRRVALARFVGAAAAVTKAAAAQAAAAQAAAAAAAQVAAADDQLPMIDLTDANIGQRSRQIETLMRTVERQRRRDLADMRSLLGDKSEDESAATTAPASESSSATSTAASTPSLASDDDERRQRGRRRRRRQQQQRRRDDIGAVQFVLGDAGLGKTHVMVTVADTLVLSTEHRVAWCSGDRFLTAERPGYLTARLLSRLGVHVVDDTWQKQLLQEHQSDTAIEFSEDLEDTKALIDLLAENIKVPPGGVRISDIQSNPDGVLQRLCEASLDFAGVNAAVAANRELHRRSVKRKSKESLSFMHTPQHVSIVIDDMQFASALDWRIITGLATRIRQRRLKHVSLMVATLPMENKVARLPFTPVPPEYYELRHGVALRTVSLRRWSSLDVVSYCRALYRVARVDMRLVLFLVRNCGGVPSSITTAVHLLQDRGALDLLPQHQLPHSVPSLGADAALMKRVRRQRHEKHTDDDFAYDQHGNSRSGRRTQSVSLNTQHVQSVIGHSQQDMEQLLQQPPSAAVRSRSRTRRVSTRDVDAADVDAGDVHVTPAKIEEDREADEECDTSSVESEDTNDGDDDGAGGDERDEDDEENNILLLQQADEEDDPDSIVLHVKLPLTDMLGRPLPQFVPSPTRQRCHTAADRLDTAELITLKVAAAVVALNTNAPEPGFDVDMLVAAMPAAGGDTEGNRSDGRALAFGSWSSVQARVQSIARCGLLRVVGVDARRNLVRYNVAGGFLVEAVRRTLLASQEKKIGSQLATYIRRRYAHDTDDAHEARLARTRLVPVKGIAALARAADEGGPGREGVCRCRLELQVTKLKNLRLGDGLLRWRRARGRGPNVFVRVQAVAQYKRRELVVWQRDSSDLPSTRSPEGGWQVDAHSRASFVIRLRRDATARDVCLHHDARLRRNSAVSVDSASTSRVSPPVAVPERRSSFARLSQRLSQRSRRVNPVHTGSGSRSGDRDELTPMSRCTSHVDEDMQEDIQEDRKVDDEDEEKQENDEAKGVMLMRIQIFERRLRRPRLVGEAEFPREQALGWRRNNAKMRSIHAPQRRDLSIGDIYFRTGLLAGDPEEDGAEAIRGAQCDTCTKRFVLEQGMLLRESRVPGMGGDDDLLLPPTPGLPASVHHGTGDAHESDTSSAVNAWSSPSWRGSTNLRKLSGMTGGINALSMGISGYSSYLEDGTMSGSLGGSAPRTPNLAPSKSMQPHRFTPSRRMSTKAAAQATGAASAHNDSTPTRRTSAANTAAALVNARRRSSMALLWARSDGVCRAEVLAVRGLSQPASLFCRVQFVPSATLSSTHRRPADLAAETTGFVASGTEPTWQLPTQLDVPMVGLAAAAAAAASSANSSGAKTLDSLGTHEHASGTLKLSVFKWHSTLENYEVGSVSLTLDAATVLEQSRADATVASPRSGNMYDSVTESQLKLPSPDNKVKLYEASVTRWYPLQLAPTDGDNPLREHVASVQLRLHAAQWSDVLHPTTQHHAVAQARRQSMYVGDTSKHLSIASNNSNNCP